MKNLFYYYNQLILHSKYYKTFANCVDVRTVAGPYLIAMKLKSGRSYKHDFYLLDILYKKENDYKPRLFLLVSNL